MNTVVKWVENARERAEQSCNTAAYEKFLGDDRCKEAKGGKRDKKRNQRGCLTRNWKPDELSGKTIMVVGENGIGDEVLTIGCLSDLVAKCESISWRCDPKLKVLFTRSFPDVTFVSDEAPQHTVEGTIYSWELIGRVRKKLKNFPWLKCHADFKPYLQPSFQLRDSLAARYRDDSRKTVGLAWRSERKGELLPDKTCDIRDVAHWAEFFERSKDKVRFVSLQYGDTTDEIAFIRWKYGVEIYQDQSIDIFNDNDAAAAQIAAMDYVVSISTTAAHLAGALGVRGWVLLQAKPFGHWHAGETICPWYPMLRPIKQTTPGDWKSVLQTAAFELDNETKSTGSGD